MTRLYILYCYCTYCWREILTRLSLFMSKYRIRRVDAYVIIAKLFLLLVNYTTIMHSINLFLMLSLLFFFFKTCFYLNLRYNLAHTFHKTIVITFSKTYFYLDLNYSYITFRLSLSLSLSVRCRMYRSMIYF